MFILGISGFYHDSAAALIEDGRIVAAVQEERFTRIKNDPSFPRNAIRWCLGEFGIGVKDLSAIAFYEKPLLKYERLLETYEAFAPRGIRSFAAAMPVWNREKLFLRQILERELREIGGVDALPLLLFPEHHLSHAASAFYPSPFASAAIVTIDGVGEWATTTICHGRWRDITMLREQPFPHSLGLLYSAFTLHCGFKVNSGEYKLMGLAPYGDPDSEEARRFRRLILDELVEIKSDGSLWLNMDYFNYATGLSMTDDSRLRKLFGVRRRVPETPIERPYMNLAWAVQSVTDDIVLALATEAKRLTGERHLTLAGGVALNCVANGRVLKSDLFEDIWIQPAAGDAGGAVGAALAAWHLWHGADRHADGLDTMSGAYLGPEYSEREIGHVTRHHNGPVEIIENEDELCARVARFIADGKVVGWFQGRLEWGPRALGNRSILADARDPAMQKRLNLKIKFRESFRPFAPSVLAEDATQYFDIDRPSPYMLLVAPVAEGIRLPLPEGIRGADLTNKLSAVKSEIPAVTHVDYSARIQTVHRETNPLYWNLISAFKALTGCSVIVNTSFNVRGEPIVCSPEDAIKCYIKTEMDALAIGNTLICKR